MAKLIQVIETEVHRGSGVPADPHRTVRQFWTPEGVLLVEHDEWADLNRSNRLTDVYIIACNPDEENYRTQLQRIARIIDGRTDA